MSADEALNRGFKEHSQFIGLTTTVQKQNKMLVIPALRGVGWDVRPASEATVTRRSAFSSQGTSHGDAPSPRTQRPASRGGCSGPCLCLHPWKGPRAPRSLLPPLPTPRGFRCVERHGIPVGVAHKSKSSAASTGTSTPST